MSTVKGYKPHVNQRTLHDAINNLPAKYYAFCIGRQFGKSLLGENQCLYWMINDKGSMSGWVSPIYKQSKKVYAEIKKATVSSGYFTYNDTDLIIKGFDSTLQFFSAENSDGIRGNTFDYLIIDEADFNKSKVWEEVLQPTVLVKGKKVVFISTPKGRKLMFKLKTLALTNENYVYYSFTSYDNPMIDPDEINAIRKTIPDHIFRQEYLAEFIDNVSGLFTKVRESISTTRENKGTLYGGLDIGRADDYTVLTVGTREGVVLHVERWRQSEWNTIVNNVAEVVNRFKANIYIEVNNQGDVFEELLARKCPNLISPFVTTSQTKPIMIEDLALSFEQNELKLPDLEWLIDELESFTYIYDTKTRRVKYGAPDGIHDDGVISLALYNQARKRLAIKGKYYN